MDGGLPGGAVRSCTVTPSGFSLIEVLVAVAILSVGMVAILSSFNVSVTTAAAARDTLAAEWVCEGKLAEVRQVADVDSLPAVLALSGDFSAVDGFSGRMQVEVDEAVATAAEDQSNVLVRVSLQAWKSNDKNVFTTAYRLVARR